MKITISESKKWMIRHTCFQTRKGIQLFLSLLFFPVFVYAQGDQIAIQVPISNSGFTEGALLHLPDDYDSTTHTYPLLLFFHGKGEAGTDLSRIYNSSGAGGPAYFIAHNQWPSYFINPKDGKPYKFIVVSPQASSWSTRTAWVPYILAYLVKHYRVDTNRIYLTGLSAGGQAVWGYAAHNGVVPNYLIAAFVPMSMAATPGYPDALMITRDSLHAWGFGDPITDALGGWTQRGMDSINRYAPGYARFTAYSGGHCCWNRYYNPTYRETINGKSINIYEWMLQYARGQVDSLPPAPDQPPVVKLASRTYTLTLPTDSVYVDGSGSYDPDGSIVSYTWKQVDGPAWANISAPNQSKTWIDSLTSGTYHFILTVVDNGNLSATDTVTLQVNPAPDQKPIVKFAARQLTITLPTDSVEADGSTSYDPDGTITSYLWTELNGPSSATLSNATQAKTWISHLQAGTYSFLLTVTDNAGLKAADTLWIYVNAAPVQYPPVVVLQSTNISVTLPQDSVYLDASKSYDSSGTIIGYQWKLIQGDTSALIVSPIQPATWLKHLRAGNYLLAITVTSNTGLQTTDTVQIQVHNMPNQPPVSIIHAGIDSIRLPLDSVWLDGSGSYDPEGGRLSYLWKQISGPAPAVIQYVNRAQTWIQQLTAGVYQFALTVTDSLGLSSTDSVLIYVDAPVVTHKRIILPVWNQLWYPNIDSQFNIQPGDTICIPAGDYPNLSIGHLNGSPEAPVVIQNCGGVVRLGVNNTGGYTFIIGSHSSYFEINGSGTPGIEYGFELVGTPAADGGGAVNGIVLQEHTDHFEVHHVFINHVRGSGIVCLTRAVCSDPSTWRQNYIMEGIKLHHIKVIGTGYEGFYIGRTADYQVDNSCTPDTLYNPLMKNVEIYDNTFDSTGNDAIQLALAYYGTNLIHDNYINYPGMNGGYGQGMGILVGGNTKADVYNNIINHAQNLPVQILGAGLTRFYNNVVCNSNTDGIQIGGGQGGLEPTAVYVFNNTFVNIKGNGIIVWGSKSDTVNRFYNNLLVNIQKPLYDQPDSGFYIPPATSIGYQIKYDIQHNLFISDINKAGFVNPSADNYHLLPTSPAVDAGIDLRSYGITTDLDGQSRPYGRAFDVGAFEYAPHPNKPPVAVAKASMDSLQLPVDSVLLDGSLSSDSDGYISAYFWRLKQGPAGWSIQHADSSKTWAYFSRPGTYIFELTVTDNAGASATDSVAIHVLSAVNQPPVAVVNPDTVIYLPTDSIWLNGTASYDPDDTVFTDLHFQWSKISGPDAYQFVDSLMDATWVKQLTIGQYVFKLVVTDKAGATDSAFVTVNVNAPSTHPTPIAYAGPDRTIQLPQDTVMLDGSGSVDSSGVIVRYRWSILSSPSGSQADFTDSLAVQTILQHLTVGQYVVQLTVTDSSGTSASDQVKIQVLPRPNTPPVANAGADITLILPDNTATLNGTASYDPDGTIVSYRWIYISGPAQYTITGAATPHPVLYGLVQGTYVFQLTVTDNMGASSSSTVQVIVKPKPNWPPVVDIRGDSVLILPQNTLVLDGSYSYDPDGHIVKYQWRQVSGPTNIQMSGMNSAQLQLQNLDIGDYTFALTVTDDGGMAATHSFNFEVRMNVSTNHSPLVVYPNPAHDIIHVFFYSQVDGEYIIRIFDINGKIWATYSYNKSHVSNFSKDININQLLPGIYLVNVTFENGTSVTQKIIKL